MKNNSANFIKIKLNFDGIENIIKNYTKYNDNQRCEITLDCLNRTGEPFLNVQWNIVKTFDLHNYHQYMNIFYNEQTNSYYFDTLNVIFKENVNQNEFKQLIQNEIARILSKNKEEERNI